MAVTLAQIEAQLDAAWAAFQVGQASYTFNGRTITLRSLEESSVPGSSADMGES